MKSLIINLLLLVCIAVPNISNADILPPSTLPAVSSESTSSTQNPPQTPTFAEAFSKSIPMFVTVFFIFYFIVLRPQQKKVQEQTNLMTNLTKGDEVILTSGFVGKIVSIDGDFATVDIGVKTKIEKSAISRKL